MVSIAVMEILVDGQWFWWVAVLVCAFVSAVLVTGRGRAWGMPALGFLSAVALIVTVIAGSFTLELVSAAQKMHEREVQFARAVEERDKRLQEFVLAVGERDEIIKKLAEGQNCQAE